MTKKSQVDIPMEEIDNLAKVGAEMHPYARYGLAVAINEDEEGEEGFSKNPKRALIYAMEIGMGQFRMRTASDPSVDSKLEFTEISRTDLIAKPNLVQESGLAAKGIYLFPTVLTTDGTAKDTFNNALSFIKLLQKPEENLFSSVQLSRSFAPTTGKINNGTASQSAPKDSLIEAVCAMITTLTPLKPSAFSKLRGSKDNDVSRINTCIIPDAPLKELVKFVKLFSVMIDSQTDREKWMSIKLKKKTEIGETKKASSKQKGSKEGIIKSEYTRPTVFDGNYPFAPRDAGIFGPVGLLAAIGRWSTESKERGTGHEVLKSLAGRQLMLVSYDQISQVRIEHHIVRLAESKENPLSEIIHSLYWNTKLFSEIDYPGVPFKKPAFKLFCTMAARFIQTFSTPAFRDFMAFRAEYAPNVKHLFNEFFRPMQKDIVQSARELGAWINKTAYFTAKAEAEARPSKDPKKSFDQQVREGKAKILATLESMILGSRESDKMLSQLLIQACRLMYFDAPHEATRFLDAAQTKEISHEQAQNLITAYMRIRQVPKDKSDSDLLDNEETDIANTKTN